jgi:hypothetical protein
MLAIPQGGETTMRRRDFLRSAAAGAAALTQSRRSASISAAP